jgi:hypothetical protein
MRRKVAFGIDVPAHCDPREGQANDLIRFGRKRFMRRFARGDWATEAGLWSRLGRGESHLNPG